MSNESDFRDTLYTIDKKGQRKWVYPHYLPGRFFRARAIVAYLLMAIYLSLPWITIAGKQGVFLDIPHRRFVFLGLELWATDTIFLFLVLAMLGMALFFFTSIFGRVWCGWACPETVFLEFLFRPIERLIEGGDAQRRRLDKAPWTVSKVSRKLLKHATCAAVSWVIASTALAYFVGREPLIEMMTQSPSANPGSFFMTLSVMGLMAFQFGWFREQFCTVLCPYARFQSVLMDQNSLLVGYDAKRGEPRGKKRSHESEERGDCIDCSMCVRVCPTGIDIRNGTQLECIACTACIDACNSIMDQVGRPRDLIRYDSEARLMGKPAHWVRPRIFVYAFLLCVLFSVFTYKLTHRSLIDIQVTRVRSDRTFVQGDDGMISNQFSLHIANKGVVPERFTLSIVRPQGVQIISPLDRYELKPGDIQKLPLFLRSPVTGFSGGRIEVVIKVESTSGEEVERALTFLGPQ